MLSSPQPSPSADTAIVDATTYPQLAQLLDSMLAVWPQHVKFLRKSIAVHDAPALATCDRMAGLVITLAGDGLNTVCADYRWTCEQLQEEELHFRRSGSYRLSSFEEAEREVYGNTAFMSRYVNGLLLSQILWANHAAMMHYYMTRFLPLAADGFHHLEVGPGHGLLLYCAASMPGNATATGWDISETSIASTRHALSALGAKEGIALAIGDLMHPPVVDTPFDMVVLSEILEHIEEPVTALRQMKSCLAPDGRLFVNVPCNSPAPDHIYLLRTPEDAVQMVKDGGYDIEDAAHFPMAGYSLERALKAEATISCCIIAKPA